MKRAVFFDVDRTLLSVNTGNLFIRWRFRRGEVTHREVLRVTRWMAQYTLGLVDPPLVTGQALSMLEGFQERRLREECFCWYHEEVCRYVSSSGRDEVARRQREGWECVILTASTPYVIAPLAEDLGIEHVLCTSLEVHEGRFTGRYVPPLCYGDGKVYHAERWARERGISLRDCAFFTDSVSDTPMLREVGEPRVVNPDPRLRMRALRRGWPVERWR